MIRWMTGSPASYGARDPVRGSGLIAGATGNKHDVRDKTASLGGVLGSCPRGAPMTFTLVLARVVLLARFLWPARSPTRRHARMARQQARTAQQHKDRARQQKATAQQQEDIAQRQGKALHNLLERDRMFTDRLREEARRLDLPVIEVSTAMTEDGLARRVTEVFGL
jgi:hypothetical protein